MEIIELPNAGDEKKSCAVSDKVVWKEKVILDYFDIAAWTLISIAKVDQKGVAPKTPYFARGRRNVTMLFNKPRFA